MSFQRPPEIPADQERLDLRAYLRPLWRRRWVVLAVVVLAAAGTYEVSAHKPEQYVSSTSVYVTDADPAGAVDSTVPPAPPTAQQMQDVATLFTAQAITTDVYRHLRLRVGAAGSVNVAPLASPAGGSSATSFVVVTATSSTAKLAARLANTYVSVFLNSQRDGQAAAARSAVTAAQRSFTALANIPTNSAERQALLLAISQYKTIALSPSAGAQQIDTAVAPDSPSSPKPTRDAVFGGILGLLLGFCIAFALEMLDGRVVQVSSIEKLYGRPVLAVLPHSNNAAPLINGRALVPEALVESMRSLRINLRLAGGAEPPRTIVVSSAMPGEGKSTVARDLALAYADAGERTLLIDADLRRPNVPALFGLQSRHGLAQVLRGELSLADAVMGVPRFVAGGDDGTHHGNGSASVGPWGALGSASFLDLLAHGERVDNPVVLLSSRAMAAMLAKASEQYDVVIVDTAPLLAVTDTVPLLAMVDIILLVARLGLTTRDAAERLADVIRRVPEANVAGVVANDLRDAFLAEGGAGYGTQYGGYSYAYGHESRGR